MPSGGKSGDLLEAVLKQRLRLKTGSTSVLQSRENSQLEFKLSFDLANRAKYARTMAAFANNQGGFIVFGVKNAPHELAGLKGKRFDEFDPAALSSYLNAVLNPEIAWESGRLEIHGVALGFLHTTMAREKPVVCTKNDDCLFEGHIYYRYRGQTSSIRFPELRALLDDRIARERRALLGHVRVIADAGPTNVGVLDLLHGKGYGGGGAFMIDESLVRDLRFVKEGSFAETQGEPTLRLVGDVQPVAAIGIAPAVPVAVHYDDLVTAFLGARDLTPANAKLYLAEAAQQTTPAVPIHSFRVLAGLSREDAAQLLLAEQPRVPAYRNRLVARLRSGARMPPVGAAVPVPLPNERDEFVRQLTFGVGGKVRSLCLEALRHRPEYLDDRATDIAGSRLWEAITHLGEVELVAVRQQLLPMMLAAFTRKFARFTPSERSAMRRAIAHVDDGLFAGR